MLRHVTYAQAEKILSKVPDCFTPGKRYSVKEHNRIKEKALQRGTFQYGGDDFHIVNRNICDCPYNGEPCYYSFNTPNDMVCAILCGRFASALTKQRETAKN